MAHDMEGRVFGTLQQTAEIIKSNMQAQGVNASGRTSASIRVREYDAGLQLVFGNNNTHTVPGGITTAFQDVTTSDTAPIQTVEIGRPGGAVPRGFYYIIREWTREKGLTFGNEQERGTFAYFVARKIAREGTQRNKQPIDVWSTPTAEAVKSIREICAGAFVESIHVALGV